MPDEVVESSTTEEQTVAEVQTAQDDGEASAETENTETPESKGHMIPKSRLDEVIQQRDTAREKSETLEAKVAEYQNPKEPEKGKADLPSPPDTHADGTALSERERIEWFIQNGSQRWFEEKFGPVKDVQTLFDANRATTESEANRRWKEGCASHKLDPTNREVQEMVLGLTKVGIKADDAFTRVSKLGVGTMKTEPSATVENTGVTGVMTNREAYAKTSKEANELARKGIRAKQLSSSEIIKQAMAEAGGK